MGYREYARLLKIMSRSKKVKNLFMEGKRIEIQYEPVQDKIYFLDWLF